MNDRLDIASRLMAGMRRGIYPLNELTKLALREADALIAEEVRTRPPAAEARAPDELRAVAEELMWELQRACDWMEREHDMTPITAHAALTRARAIGLGEKREGGGK